MNISGGNILFKAWKEPLVRSAFIELFKTFIQKSRIPDNKDDETIGDFFRRRGCPDIANNMVSAMIHGIYAGDIDELSVMSVFPSIVLWEQRFGSPYECLKWHVLEYLIGISGLPQISNYQQREFNHFYADDILSRMSSKDKLLSASIYTLRGGLQTLSTALMENLRRNPRVKLITEATVDHIGSVSTIEDKNKVREAIFNIQQDANAL